MKMATDYETLAEFAPPGKLDMVLDQENDRDKHLAAIAGMMDEKMMALKLCPMLEIRDEDIHVIQWQNSDYPRNMRINFLRKWKSEAGNKATYKRLVRSLLYIRDYATAQLVVQLLQDEYQPQVANVQQPAQSAKQPAQSAQQQQDPPLLAGPGAEIPQQQTGKHEDLPAAEPQAAKVDGKLTSIKYYDMKKKPHGIALIINNFEFKKEGLNNLYGYKQDEENLKATLEELHYIVQPHHNMTIFETVELIKEVAKLDHSEYDSFICCILSHGDKGCVLDCNGSRIRINDNLSSHLKKVSSLAGKPKIFFIQACRGEDLSTGHRDVNFQEFTRDFKVPFEADFVFGYATPLHSVAFVEEGGSHYITELCKSLEAHAHYAPLHAIMTDANRLVGEHVVEEKYKQAPVFNSGARKDIFFY